MQVHCVRAYGKVLEAVQQLGPFPAGLVLHSFAGPAEMVGPLAQVPCMPGPSEVRVACHTGHLLASTHLGVGSQQQLPQAGCRCLPRLVQGASPSLHQIDDTVMCAGSVPSIPYMLQPHRQITSATEMWEVQGFVSLRLWGFQVEGVHFSISGHITKVPVEKAEVMLKQVTLQAGQLPACPAFNVSPQCSWWILGLAMFHALD